MTNAALGFEQVAPELVAAVRSLHARGWAEATSGNFSARLGAAFVITQSGLDKGEITEAGLLCVDLDGRPLTMGAAPPKPGSGLIPPSTGRPSAETALHASLYRRFANA